MFADDGFQSCFRNVSPFDHDLLADHYGGGYRKIELAGS